MDRRIVLSLAMLTMACGSSEEADTRAPLAKPEAISTSSGAEALVFPVSTRIDREREGTARGALRVRAWAPTPIGPLRADAREAYRIVLEAQNESGAPLAVDPSWARARIQRRGEPLEGCQGNAVRVPATEAVSSDGSLFVSLPAPCPLEEPGVYQAFVDLSIGAPFDEGREILTAQTEIEIDGSLPPFRGDDLPPVSEGTAHGVQP